MAFLSDHTIKASIAVSRIVVDPYDPDCVQPASYDMHLDSTFKRITGPSEIDPRKPVEYQDINVMKGYSLHLKPHAFILGSTIERIELANDLIGRLEGKSSLGRIGLTAHVTAGFFDPGFRGHATLELFNASDRVIVLWPGMKICQMSFARITTSAERPYGHKDLRSNYQDQERGPKGSQMHRNFDA